jgi:hypothetical protein
MSKDPAFLFYSSDFLTGTFTMSNEQVGKYIRLLCLQHQKIELTEKDMLNICKTYDEDIYSKFECIDGLYYNKRLRDESIKRKEYSESRKNNRKKKDMSNICKTYDSHMENENENVNENINKDKIVLKKFNFSDLNGLPIQYIQSTREQLKIQKQLQLDEKTISSMWEAFKLQYLNGKESYKNEDEVYKHFINWIKKQNFNNEQQSNTNSKPNSKAGKKLTSDERFEFYTNYASQFSDGSNEKQTD